MIPSVKTFATMIPGALPVASGAAIAATLGPAKHQLVCYDFGKSNRSIPETLEMRCLWLVCVLLGTLAWGQAKLASPQSALTRATAAAKGAEDDDDQPPTSASKVAPSATVLTITGLCDAGTAQATASSTSSGAKACGWTGL